MKLFAFIFSLSIVALEFFLLYYFLYFHPIHFFYVLSFFIVPVFFLLIFWTIVNRVQKNYLGLLRRITVLHYVFVVGVYLVLGFIFPFLYSLYSDFSAEEKGKILENAYNYAQVVHDEEEILALAYFYYANKDAISGFSIDSYTIEGIKDLQGKKEAHSFQNELFDELIINEEFFNMDRKTMMFHIKNYIDRSYFYSAQLLLSYYEYYYGVDEQYQRMREILNTYLSDVGTKVVETERQHVLLRTISNLHSVIRKNTVHIEEIISIYYIVQSLLQSNVNNEVLSVLQWLDERVQDRLSEQVFFAGDARIKLFGFHDNSQIVYIITTHDGVIVTSAVNSFYDEDTDILYLEELEQDIISWNSGRIIQKVQVPYAKVENNMLYLYSIERSIPGIHYVPQYSYPDIARQEIVDETIYTQPLDIEPDTLRMLRPEYRFIAQSDIVTLIQLFFVWENYRLPLHMLSEVMLRTLMMVFYYCIIGMLFIRYVAHTVIGNKTLRSVATVYIIIVIGSAPLLFFLEKSLVFIVRNIPDSWQIWTVGIFFVVMLFLLLIVLFLLATSMKAVKALEAK